jgi:probable HAF family extracellular repeat protein
MRMLFSAALVVALALTGCGGSEGAPPSNGGSSGGGAPGGGTPGGAPGNQPGNQPPPPAVHRTLALSVTGPGTVRSPSLSSDCRGSCRIDALDGALVHLEAAPDDAGEFSAWSGACNGTGACDVVLSSDVSVSAAFATAMDLLTVQVIGGGRGRVVSTPPGIDCSSGAVCSARFPRTSKVRLAAAPDAISVLGSWSGLCAAEPCAFKMKGDGAVAASFALRRYSVLDLGVAPPGDWWSNAVAISAKGRIVAGSSGGLGRPVIFTPSIQTLGVDRGYSVGVNSSRTVAGNYQASIDSNGFPIWRPFRSSKGVLTDLPFLPQGNYGSATAMNEAGIVVGFSAYGGNSPSRAVYWNDSGVTDLGSLGPDWMACSMAFAINGAGAIVGETCTRFFAQHAARFRAPGMIDDLGTLGGNHSRATGINDGGDIVGFSDLPQGNGGHGFFWRNGTMADAGALPGHSNSQLNAVNNSGVAVGISFNPNEYPLTGILYLDGRVVALDDLVDDPRSIRVTDPTGIDDANAIAANATIFGAMRAVLLLPK